MELYACCHIPELPTQAALRLRPALGGKAVLVIEGEPPWEQVCSHNGAAQRLGVAHGMSRTQFEMFPGLVVLRRSLREERAAAAALLEGMGALSPRIEDASRPSACTVVLDVAGTGRLLGSSAEIARRVTAQAAALGLKAAVAVSSNFHAALCAARAGSSIVISPGDEAAALARLPLASIDPDAQHAEAFAHWGVRTLGQVATLPEEGLITRFGQAGKRLRQLARGECPHLFRPVEPALALDECMELEAPLELMETLLFLLHPMLDQLLLRARTHALALAHLTLTLSLDGGGEHTRRIRPALATEDKALLLKLLQLDLLAHPPTAAVLGLRLSGEAGATSKVQLGLFSPQLPEPSRLDVTLARLRAVVGGDRVGSPALDDTHRPDSFQMSPFMVPVRQAAESPRAASTVRRRLRPPEPVEVRLEGRRPCAMRFRGEQYRVDKAYGPWLNSGAWWSREVWSFEQWDVLARAETTQSRIACCLVRDYVQRRWQIEALYD